VQRPYQASHSLVSDNCAAGGGQTQYGTYALLGAVPVVGGKVPDSAISERSAVASIADKSSKIIKKRPAFRAGLPNYG